jgi:hypothetical protein
MNAPESAPRYALGMSPLSSFNVVLRRAFVAIVAITLVAACGVSNNASPSASASAPSAPASGGSCPTAADPGSPPGWTPPSTPPSVLPVFINISGELTCGQNRFLFSFIDQRTKLPVGAPDRSATVSLFDLARDPNKPTMTVTPSFVWAIQNERGVYVAEVEFSEAGVWGFEFKTEAPGGQSETIRATYNIAPSTSVVRVGQPAPSTKTPTATDVGGDLTKLSTDTKPDSALYKTSVDQALAKHEPFALVFATPRFCQTAQCGPTLDRVKPFVAKYPGVTFIHVEPYQLQFDGTRLQPVLTGGQLTPTETVNKWGLLSEPWVFVVDRQGIVRGSFELIFSDDELTKALDAVK